jgi:hypothetical protein
MVFIVIPVSIIYLFIVTVIDVQRNWKYLPGYFRDGVEKVRNLPQRILLTCRSVSLALLAAVMIP